MKQCLNLSFCSVKDDEAKIKFFEKAIKENKIDGSYTWNGYQYTLNCTSDVKCKQCNFEEHCYFGIRKLSKSQFIVLADKFPEIKKVNQSDIKFGTIVKLQTRLLKIKESKLSRLRAFYGKCLSERQTQMIQNKFYDDESDEKYITVNYEDLIEVNNNIKIGMIISTAYGAYYYSDYISDESFNGSTRCIAVVNKPPIILNTAGKDFEDYFVWTEPEIIEILSPEESQKYLEKQKDFYSCLNV